MALNERHIWSKHTDLAYPCDMLQVPNASSIANLAWAFLTLGHKSPEMLAALARAAVLQKVSLWVSDVTAWLTCGLRLC